MKLNITKRTVSCLRRVLREVKEQEETLEIRLNEGMPDIDRVIACWGQSVIRCKEWRNNGICVSGGIMAWVMYMSDEGDTPQYLDAWIPFQMKYNFEDSENDGGMLVQPLIHSLDARNVSARKVMLRAVIGVSCDAMVNSEFEICTPCDVPEDVQLLKREYSFMVPKSIGEKTFRIEEYLSEGEIICKIDRIVYYQASASVSEQKVMGDKVIFRGVLKLHMLYSDVEGKLSCLDSDFPFSQYGELDNEFSNDADSQIIMSVSSLDIEKNENGEYKLSVGMIGQYVVFDKETVTLVEDAYSPQRQVRVNTGSLCLPAVDAIEMSVVPTRTEIKVDDLSVLDAVMNPAHSMSYMDDGKLVTEHSGTYRVLGRNNTGELIFKTEIWHTSDEKETNRSIKNIAGVPFSVKTHIDRTGLEVQLMSEMQTVEVRYLDECIPMLVSLEIGDAVNCDPNRPCLILRKADGGSLWSIAKQTGSTVDQIVSANGLAEEPEVDRILLIPVK